MIYKCFGFRNGDVSVLSKLVSQKLSSLEIKDMSPGLFQNEENEVTPPRSSSSRPNPSVRGHPAQQQWQFLEGGSPHPAAAAVEYRRGGVQPPPPHRDCSKAPCLRSSCRTPASTAAAGVLRARGSTPPVAAAAQVDGWRGVTPSRRSSSGAF